MITGEITHIYEHTHPYPTGPGGGDLYDVDMVYAKQNRLFVKTVRDKGTDLTVLFFTMSRIEQSKTTIEEERAG